MIQNESHCACRPFDERVQETDEVGSAPDTAFLGLFGEIGSLVSALKKRRRDKDAFFGYERAVVEEVGDVLWYASAFARRGAHHWRRRRAGQ